LLATKVGKGKELEKVAQKGKDDSIGVADDGQDRDDNNYGIYN